MCRKERCPYPTARTRSAKLSFCWNLELVDMASFLSRASTGHKYDLNFLPPSAFSHK